MTATSVPDRSSQVLAIGVLGLAVTVGVAAYATRHPGNGATIVSLGFTSLLAMKSWLSMASFALVLVQLLTSFSMWSRWPGAREMPSWVPPVHRWSGAFAFVLLMPVVFHCIWSIGFESGSVRTVAHSIGGCVFFGIFAAKMLALRLEQLPARALPVLGGSLVAVFAVVWLTSAVWYFAQPGVALR